jgi:predicted peptidase
MAIRKQQTVTFSTRVRMDVRARYLLYLPEGYGELRQMWPLVLFLHGAGERGSDVNAVRRHGPPKLVDQGKEFPFILVSPQCPEDESWSVPVVRALLDEVQDRYAVDSSRVYLTGLSMGGNGTWRLGTMCPERFAALAPVCGWGDPDRVCVLKDVPVWVFHGRKDRVVPFRKSEEMVKALRACGGNVRFTAYPDAAHDSWTETYSNPAFFKWLLDQRLSPSHSGRDGVSGKRRKPHKAARAPQ